MARPSGSGWRSTTCQIRSIPEEIGFWNSTGKGVHRIVYEGGRYAYVSARPDGFEERIWVIVDVSDPEHPTERARWWWPGMGDDETPSWPADESRSVHHAMVEGDRAYVGFWDSGMVILDISDLDDISVVSHLQWDGRRSYPHRTPDAGPESGRRDRRGAVEQLRGGPAHGAGSSTSPTRRIPRSCRSARCPRVTSATEACGSVPIASTRTDPTAIGAPTSCSRRTSTVDSASYDVSEPSTPRDIAHWIPECPPGQPACQINDVWVGEDLLTYVTDRVNGGVYVLEPEPDLADRLREASL